MRMDKKRCYRKNSRIVYKETDGCGVLIDPYRRTLIELNPAARQIWQLLDGSRSCVDIIGDLGMTFEADQGELERDVVSFLKGLLMREMIQ